MPSQVRGPRNAAPAARTPPSRFPGFWWHPSCLLLPTRGLFPAATRPPFPLCHRSTQRRARYAACFETNDEKQCVGFTSSKGGFQRIVTTLFTCQVQGRFPTGPGAAQSWGLAPPPAPRAVRLSSLTARSVARGSAGGLPLTPTYESVISELGLEIDSVTLAGTSSVLVFLSPSPGRGAHSLITELRFIRCLAGG